MTLKAILDSLDGLPADVAKEYEEKDGKFYLLLEDDVRDHPKAKALKVALERTQAKLRESAAKLTEVEAKLAEFPTDFDPEKFAAEQDELVALRAKKKKPGEPDEEGLQQKKLFEQRIAAAEKKHKDEKDKLEEEKRQLIANIERLVADEGLTKALVAVGVDKKLMPGATALLRHSVKVRKDATGEWSGYFETDLGETGIDDYVQTWAQSDEGTIYIAKAKGGNGSGGDGNRNLGEGNPWDTQGGKIKPNLTKQQAIIVANPDKARQLATAAGAPVTW